MTGLLARLGYEPRPTSADGGGVRLSNCPFQQLSDDHTDVICPINREFIGAVGHHLGCLDVHPEPADRGTGCCVGLRSTPST